MPSTIKGGERATTRKKKLFVQVFGPEGTGKTSFGLSFPSPLWIVNFDRNMDDLLEKLPSHYDIHYEEVQWDVDMNRGLAANTVIRVRKLFEEAVKGGQGTFFMDGADLYWEYVKVAKLPDDADIPNQWGPANSEMSNFLRRAESCPLHVVFTSIASNVWEGMQKETRKMKADGFKHTGRFINTKVYLFTPEDHSTPVERPQPNVGQTHSAYINTSKLDERIVGSVIPNLSFKMLYRSIFRELPPEHEKLWVPGAKEPEVQTGAVA